MRTLDRLLEPGAARETEFWVGGAAFDPDAVGFVTDPHEDNAYLFDTRLPGNGNLRHEGEAYGTSLGADDKAASRRAAARGRGTEPRAVARRSMTARKLSSRPSGPEFAILGLTVFVIATGIALWRQYEGNRERERERAFALALECFALTHAGAAAERVLTSAGERGFDDLAKIEAYVADIEHARAEIAGTAVEERALVEARDHLAQAIGEYGRVMASVSDALSTEDGEAVKAAADRIAPAAAALGPATAEVAAVCDPPDA